MHIIGQLSIDEGTKTSPAQTKIYKPDGHLLLSDGQQCVASKEVITTSAALQPVITKDLNSSWAYLTVPRKYFCNEWLKDPDTKLNSRLVVLHKFITSHLPQNYKLEEPVAKLICELSNQLSKLWHTSCKKKDLFLIQIADWLNEPPVKFKLREIPNKNNTKLEQPKIQEAGKVVHGSGLNTKLSPKPTPQTTVIAKQVPEIKIKLEKYSDILDLLKKSKPSFQPDVLIHILTTGNDCKDLTEENKDTIVKFANRVVTDMRFKWLTANGQDKLFEDKFGYWLQLNIKWPECFKAIIIERNAKYDSEVQASIASKTRKQSYLEKTLTDKLSEVGCNNISEVIHRLVNHPEDAASISEFITKSQCKCIQTELDGDIEIKSEPSSPDRDDPLRLPEETTPELPLNSRNRPPITYSNPTNAQRLMLRGILDRLKVTNNITEPSLKRKKRKADEVEDEEKSNDEEADALDDDDDDEEEIDRVEEDYEVEALDPEEEVWESETLDQEVCELETLDQEEETDKKVEVAKPNPCKPLARRPGPKLKPVFMVLPGQKLQPLDFGPVLDRALFVSSDTISPDIIQNAKGDKTVLLNNKINGTVAKISNLNNAVAVIPVLNNKKGMKVLPRRRRMTMVLPSNTQQTTSVQQQSVLTPPVPNIKSMIQTQPLLINSKFKVMASASTTSIVQATPSNFATRTLTTPSYIKTSSAVQKTTMNSEQAVEAIHVSKTSAQKATSLNALLANIYSPVKAKSKGEEPGKQPLLTRNVKVIPKASLNVASKKPKILIKDVTQGSIKRRTDKKKKDEPPAKKMLLKSLSDEKF